MTQGASSAMNLPDLRSNPLDMAHPGFDSLLSALQFVYEHPLFTHVLERYHGALSAQVDEAERAIRERPELPALVETFDGIEAVLASRRDVACGALAIVRVMLDALKACADDFTPERVATCVSLYLEARRVTDEVGGWLDLVGLEPPSTLSS